MYALHILLSMLLKEIRKYFVAIVKNMPLKGISIIVPFVKRTTFLFSFQFPPEEFNYKANSYALQIIMKSIQVIMIPN